MSAYRLPRSGSWLGALKGVLGNVVGGLHIFNGPRFRVGDRIQNDVWSSVQGIVEDVYLSIAGGDSEAIVLDVFVFPLIWLLWLGGLIVVAGGFVAIAGRRTLPDSRAAVLEAGSTADE